MEKPEVVPLITIQDEKFRHQYELGVWCALSEDRQERTPIADSYLVIHLKYVAACGYFLPQYAHKLCRFGFCLGMYHGAVLSTQATALLTFSHEESQKGYRCGRRAYFTELSHQERTYTDETLLCLFAQIMQDNRDCLDGGDDSLLYWCVGDFFGGLERTAVSSQARGTYQLATGFSFGSLLSKEEIFGETTCTSYPLFYRGR